MLAILLSLLLTASGLQITVQSPAGCHPCYVQIDPSDGLSAAPQIFQFDLAPGDSFGATVNVAPVPGLHANGERVRVRVWDGGEGPSADQTIAIAVAPLPERVYLPLEYRAAIN